MGKAVSMVTVFAFLVTSPITRADIHEAEHSPQLTIKEDGDREVVMIGDKLFAGYNDKQTHKPYIYPIIGPTGANMTRHYPMKKGVEGEATDHPHHTSLWFAHGNVNGVDYWHAKQGTPGIQNRVNAQPRFAVKRARIAAEDVWLKPDHSKLATTNVDYEFEVLSDGSRVMDYSTSIQSANNVEQLVFGDTKEGTMAIRLAPQLRLKGKVATGQCINSEGDKNNEAWGKRAKWVAYWGVIDGKTCGVAVFDHPTNLRHPTWWHARDYGLVAANPFGVSDFENLKPRGKGEYTLKAGQTLELKYRFVFFAGTAEDADIAGKYAHWVKETTADDEKEEGDVEPEKEE